MANENNPILPHNSDYSNQTNRSGTLREAVADTGSRTADALSGRDDDLHMQQTGFNTYNSGTTYDRYYSPVGGREHLSGLFHSRSDAENAVSRLEALGVPRSDISVILRNERETAAFAEHVGSKAGEGAGAGSAIGGTVGAIIGALVATATSIAIPGAGIVLAGPIAGALAGAGAGGLTGGLLGALVGAGIPEETARTYQQGLESGGVVVVADVPAALAGQARAILGTSY